MPVGYRLDKDAETEQETERQTACYTVRDLCNVTCSP